LSAEKKNARRGSIGGIAERAGRVVYLRDAQAYTLISMPTDTSTIFGVFQLIRFSQKVPIKDLSRPMLKLEGRQTQRRAL